MKPRNVRLAFSVGASLIVGLGILVALRVEGLSDLQTKKRLLERIDNLEIPFYSLPGDKDRLENFSTLVELRLMILKSNRLDEDDPAREYQDRLIQRLENFREAMASTYVPKGAEGDGKWKRLLYLKAYQLELAELENALEESMPTRPPQPSAEGDIRVDLPRMELGSENRSLCRIFG